LFVYRYDEKDYQKEQKPINTDEYSIKKIDTILLTKQSVLKSTEVNENMINTLGNYDLGVQTNSQYISSHHDIDLPMEVINILSLYKPNYEKLIHDGKIKKE